MGFISTIDPSTRVHAGKFTLIVADAAFKSPLQIRRVRAVALCVLTSFSPESAFGREVSGVSHWPGNQVPVVSRADIMQTTSHSRSKTGKERNILRIVCNE